MTVIFLEVKILKKNKTNILLIICGLLFIIISLIVGFMNDFSGGQGFLLLSVGTGLLAVGIAFTPRIWELICKVADIITMFFSGLK